MDPNAQVYYEIMIDRFHDGYTGNNLEPWYDGSHKNWRMYWGGDLSGIEEKLGYIGDLGATGIWITPSVQNPMCFYDADNTETSYHGYHALDYKRIENRFSHYNLGWESFDNLVSAANNKGIGTIVDFAPNHSNPSNKGVYGELHDNGICVIENSLRDNEKARFNKVERSWQNRYHHNGGVDDWSSRWSIRYQNIYALSDFNHMNEWVDSYLKEAVSKFLKRDIQGFRIDASKHMNQGWLKTLADNIYAQRNVFMMHEWYQNFGSEMMWDLAKFDNQSGMHELNIPLNTTIKDTFARDSSSLVNLDDRVHQQMNNFKWNHKLLNFVDSHDTKRFMNILHSKRMFEIANGFVMTAPGIPIIYYGTEQYLHSNQGTGDPYNRPMMSNWNRDTGMFHLIENLATLRRDNPALRYGNTYTRYVSSSEGWDTDNGVYVFERKFHNNTVLVALSKCSKDVTLSDVNTALPDGTYQDYLDGLLDGQSISVSSGQINSLDVPAKSFAVWQYKESSPSGPHIGAINPTTARAGSQIRISGEGFGDTTGNVYLQSAEGTWSATVKAWTSSDIEFIAPEGASTSGNQYLKVYVEDENGNTSNKIDFYYLSGRQVPIVQEVENTKNTNLETEPGEYLFITGSENEYSSWSDHSWETSGAMYTPDWPDWFFTTSAPASETIGFKHLKATLGNNGVWESGGNHEFTAPENGVKYVVVEASAPIAKSTDSEGTEKNSYNLKDNVYVTGFGLQANTSYNIYVVDNRSWSDGENLVGKNECPIKAVATDSDGSLDLSLAWENAEPGYYDIIVDNGDAEYDSSADGLDDVDVVGAGLFVAPEPASILAFLACFGALFVLVVGHRR